MLFTAIGQRGAPRRSARAGSKLKDGRIVVDDERRTSATGVWAAAIAWRAAGPHGRGRRGRQAGGALDRRRARRRLSQEEDRHGRSQHRLSRHQVAEPVLARLGAADRPQGQCRARLSRRLGRRRVEDARRSGPAGRQRLRRALRRAARTRPASIAFNNIELITDRDLEINLREIKEVKRDVARSRPRRVADGSVRRGLFGRPSSSASRRPSATASSSTSAARTA